MQDKNIHLGKSWVLIRENGNKRVCNFKNNYYGDQICYNIKDDIRKKK